jgi:L-amino acid N-acyltransferase YncA
MIRIAEARDAEQIVGIYRPYVEKTAISFEEEVPSVGHMADKIERVGSEFPFIVYEAPVGAGSQRGADSELLGYAYATRYRERAAYRWSLEDSVYVREDAVGRGIGRALLTRLVELLRELGYLKVYAVIAPPNPASVVLHEKLGFVPLCRFEDTAFKLGSWQSIDWMELTLREIPALPDEPLSFPDFARECPERLAEILGGAV